MDKPANIYSAVIFDLHPRIKGYIDELNQSGQIDLDNDGYPFLLSVQRQGQNHVCQTVRNGAQENFIINTRRKAEPICSWDNNDGFVRQGGKRVIQIQPAAPSEAEPKPERRKRTVESFERIVDQIVKPK